MKRKNRITDCVAVLALAAVLLAWAVPSHADTQAVSTSIAPAARQDVSSPQSLSGSYVAFDSSVGGDTCFDAGESQTLCFRAESFSSDWEWVFNVWFKFPSDWTVTNAYVQGTPACSSGTSWGVFSWSFQTSPYEVNIAHSRYHATTDHCTAYYCFDVTPAAAGVSAPVSWYWDGDSFGATPHFPCSDDGYTPSGYSACDQAVQPQALVSNCSSSRYVLDTGDPNERLCNPRSYTDLGNGIVLDNETRLEWMQATAPGTYTWPEALDYIDELNDNETLGYDDWRLPTIEELSTLVDAGRYSSAIDPIFNDTVASGAYWSSTTYAYDNYYAWGVGFYYGYVYYGYKFNYGYVRAVRSGPYGSLDNYVINGDGTVTDTTTDLMWQQCIYGQTWDGDNCTGSAATRTWDEAAAYVQELNDNNTLGYDDWRLPTRNELQSLVNYSLYEPATTFPGEESLSYWSSTTNAENTSIAWYVDFLYGYITFNDKSDGDYVRAVRGGQCRFNGDCVVDADCDDGAYCNGVETCADGVCVDGPGDPCAAGEICNEATDVCDDCVVDADCYDGIFCNGVETCVAGVCVDGPGDPCVFLGLVCDEEYTGCVGCLADADCADGQVCDAALNICVAASECTADVDCDDTLFCTGVETCVEGACVDGPGDPCEAGETCDEALDTCVTVPECAADVDCDDTLFCTGAETCVAGACVDGPGAPCAAEQTCDEVGDRCVECLNDSQCAASERCADNVCIARCTLAIKYKKPVADKLKNDKNVRLKITGGEGFDPYGVIDLGPFEAVKPKVNTKKNSLKVKAVVPAGTAPGTYPISVGDCIGEIEIL